MSLNNVRNDNIGQGLDKLGQLGNSSATVTFDIDVVVQQVNGTTKGFFEQARFIFDESSASFKNSLLNMTNAVINSVSNTANGIATTVQTNVNNLKDFAVNKTLTGIKAVGNLPPVKAVSENPYVQSAGQYVSDNALAFEYAGAALGGYVAADAGIKLLRNDPGTNKTREAVRLLAGSAIASASINYSTNDVEKNALTIVALSAALAKTTWSATTNPIINRVFILKTFG